jgi:hypothetical protein
MISAAEQHVLGCPLPASVVDRTESMRRRVAMFISAGTRAAAATAKLRALRNEIIVWQFTLPCSHFSEPVKKPYR